MHLEFHNFLDILRISALHKIPVRFFRPFQRKTPHRFLGSFSWFVFLRCGIAMSFFVLQAMCQGTFGQKVTTEMVSSRTRVPYGIWCWVTVDGSEIRWENHLGCIKHCSCRLQAVRRDTKSETLYNLGFYMCQDGLWRNPFKMWGTIILYTLHMDSWFPELRAPMSTGWFRDRFALMSNWPWQKLSRKFQLIRMRQYYCFLVAQTQAQNMVVCVVEW